MTRGRKIEIRLTEEEWSYIENICTTYGISKSEFIRRAIRSGGNMNTKYMAEKLYNMQCIVNKLNYVGATDEEIDFLVKETNELWQYLN